MNVVDYRSEQGVDNESQTRIDLNVNEEEQFEDEEEAYNEGRFGNNINCTRNLKIAREMIQFVRTKQKKKIIFRGIRNRRAYQRNSSASTAIRNQHH